GLKLLTVLLSSCVYACLACLHALLMSMYNSRRHLHDGLKVFCRCFFFRQHEKASFRTGGQTVACQMVFPAFCHRRMGVSLSYLLRMAFCRFRMVFFQTDGRFVVCCQLILIFCHLLTVFCQTI